MAGASPLLAWRRPIYIIAGFAGVIAMALLLLQPLLAGGYLPGLPSRRGRKLHAWIGGALIIAILVHVGALWITSPPDVVHALAFQSPTPFSAWGVIAMWAAFAAVVLALFRKRLRARAWRLGHMTLTAMVIIGSVVHALLIEGTMGQVSKAVLCALALLAAGKLFIDLRPWLLLRRRAP